jgi:hypothetical protein
MFLAFVVAATQTVVTQNANQKTRNEACEGPIYKGKEVTKKAKITRMVAPEIPTDVFARVRGVVQIRAVFCVTGKVTILDVIHRLPYGVTESVIKALVQTEFKPAEKDGQPVSQFFIHEVQFDGVHF